MELYLKVRPRKQRHTAKRIFERLRDECGFDGGYSRRNFMVPMPRFASWAAFNDYLEEQCLNWQADILRGHKISIGERLQADLAAVQGLPAVPFEACDLRSGQVTSTSVVRYRGNDYSVPVAFGHREVWIKGCVDRVVIGCAAEVIAKDARSE